MDIALICTVATSAAVATWFVCSAVKEVATALRVHVVEEKTEREELAKRVVKIEDVKKRQRR